MTDCYLRVPDTRHCDFHLAGPTAAGHRCRLHCKAQCRLCWRWLCKKHEERHMLTHPAASVLPLLDEMEKGATDEQRGLLERLRDALRGEQHG